MLLSSFWPEVLCPPAPAHGHAPGHATSPGLWGVAPLKRPTGWDHSLLKRLYGFHTVFRLLIKASSNSKGATSLNESSSSTSVESSALR